MTTVTYIIIAILSFGILVLLHELGHFLSARACGVKINEFSIGMGPRIGGFTDRAGIKYNLRLFPIGGYVSMKGEDEEAEGSDSFANKRPWQKLVIVAAGGVTNIILAFVLMFGITVTSEKLASNVVYDFKDGSTSSSVLMQNDRIVKVGNTATHNFYDMAYEIMHSGYEPIDLQVIRNGERITLKNVTFPTTTNSGMLIGNVDFRPYAEQKNVGNILKQTFFRSISSVKMIWDSLGDMVFGRVSVEAVSGPVGVTVALGDAAKSGVGQYIYLLAMLTMNLGVVNLLPLPALDGGRLVFILFEMVAGRKVPAKYEGAVHLVGIVLLMILMVLITFKDIVGLL